MNAIDRTHLQRAFEKLARFMTWILLGTAALLLWFVSALSERLFAAHAQVTRVFPIDARILSALATLRRPWLNGVAVDLTALGSSTLLGLFTTLALAAALAGRQYRTARHLLFASIGAGLLNLGLKDLLERPRPSIVPRLVQVAGYSYPSGHSMGSAAIYTTFAILSLPYLRTHAQRVMIIIIAESLVLLIGCSRMYLGVHYPSDVAAGIALGIAWSLLLEALARHMRVRGRPNRPL